MYFTSYPFVQEAESDHLRFAINFTPVAGLVFPVTKKNKNILPIFNGHYISYLYVYYFLNHFTTRKKNNIITNNKQTIPITIVKQ